MNTEPGIEQSQPAWLRVLRRHIESLRFGTVQVVVHEARVVQIDKTEKIRFDKPDVRGPEPSVNSPHES